MTLIKLTLIGSFLMAVFGGGVIAIAFAWEWAIDIWGIYLSTIMIFAFIGAFIGFLAWGINREINK